MRCPHCGEPVRPGQETCFACGEKLRAKHFRRQKTFDIRIVIFGAALVVIGLIGFWVVHLSGQKATAQKSKTKSVQQVGAKRSRTPLSITSKVRDSAPDTSRLRTDDEEVTRAKEQLERLKKRYETVKSQVLGESPTPEQQDLMAQIDRGLSTFQRTIFELTGSLNSQRRQDLEKEIAEQQREINNLISKFSRAPKNR